MKCHEDDFNVEYGDRGHFLLIYCGRETLAKIEFDIILIKSYEMRLFRG